MTLKKLLAIIPVLAVLLAACDDSNPDTATPPEGKASAVGTVLDGSTVPPAPVAGATVSGGGQTAQTDNAGKFNLQFNVEGNASVSLLITKSGYRDTTVLVELTEGEISSPTVLLAPRSVVSGGSRTPKTIAFLGANPNRISVYGVGGTETTVLGWEVRDSLGRALDADNAVDIAFRIVNGPGGGEYVSPSVRRTDANGETYVTLNAGTRSGVVQVVGEVSYAGTVFQSYPVRVIIDGGFPVQERFSIAAPHYNFAALNWMGRTLAISILAGDVYSNPVAPGTAVYFRSSAGVIQPSIFTNGDGQGTIDLISGNPDPLGAFAAASPLDTGYHYVVAKTVGQGGATVTDSILVLWSGISRIKNPPASGFAIGHGLSQSFTFSVCDQYHHPLAPGTVIAVSATVPPPSDPNAKVNQIQLSFGVGGRLTLNDYLFRGPGSTDFSFTLSDGSADVNQPTVVVVTIAVTSDNGNVSYTFSGTVN